MNMKKRYFSHGFTLVELLVVITIIAILAALVLSTAGGIQDKAARSRAQSEIAALSAALESYKADNGDYPGWTNAPNVAGNKFVVTNLMPSSGKVYFEFSKNMTNSSGDMIDPWGVTYGYQYPGNTNRSGSNFFDLYTYANKGSTNSNGWIKNW